MPELKTFIFTDIVGSVGLKRQMPGQDDIDRDQAYVQMILSPHRARIEAELEDRGGRIVSTAGDGHFLVFSDTIQAAKWAVGVQRGHQSSPILMPTGAAVEVRISLHVGVPQVDPRDPHNFVGKPVDYAARLNDFAQGGQILISKTGRAILDDAGVGDFAMRAHGRRILRGIGEVEIHELVYQETGPRETLLTPAPIQPREWTVLPLAETHAHRTASASKLATLSNSPRPDRVGNYELGELIGVGGMGDVYKAHHVQFGRTSAVKIIKPQYVNTGHEEIVRRFYREIKAIGKLQHRNIVVAIDSSTPGDAVHYLVMEYVEGVTLDEVVEHLGPLPVADACEIGRQVSLGLAYIHQHGIVHRDIKPSNLMLTVGQHGEEYASAGGNGGVSIATRPAVVKILDLGLALLDEDRQDRLTCIDRCGMGTGMYMSPEQWRTTSVDIRADIYSLGCTLYHLLAGHPPFVGSDLKPEKAHELAVIPPIERDAEIPSGVWNVITRSLCKSPEDRFQTPEEVAAALAPFCSGQNLSDLLRISLLETKPTAGASAPVGGRRDRQQQDRRVVRSDVAKSLGRPVRWLPWIVAALAVTLLGAWAITGTDGGLSSSERDAVVGTGGLHGQWWFHETPWMQPAIRLKLLEAIDRGEQVVGGIPLNELYQACSSENAFRGIELSRTVATALNERLDSRDKMIAYQIATLDSSHTHSEIYAEQMAELTRQVEELALDRAVDLHQLAVLQHELSKWDEARDSYLRAIASYEEEGGPAALLSLCRSDYGRMLSDAKQYREAAAAFRRAYDEGSPSPAFEMLMLIQQAQATYRLGIIPGALELMKAAEAVKDVPSKHPLRAFLHERRGWILNDAWQPDEASEDFHQGFEIINYQLGTYRNRLLTDLLIWVQQGLATTESFRGNWDRAIEIYSALEEFVRRALVSNELREYGIALDSRQHMRFRERLPSIYLRLGDGYLLGSSRQADQALKYYDLCIAECRDLGWEKTDPRAPYVIDWRYKRCLPVLFESGQADAEDRYLAVMARELELRRENYLVESQEKVYANTKLVVGAFLDIASEESERVDAGIDVLFEFVVDAERPLGRHLLGIYMLSIERLATSRLREDPARLVQLALAIDATFGGRSGLGELKIRGYLRPFLADLLAALETASEDADASSQIQEAKRSLEAILATDGQTRS